MQRCPGVAGYLPLVGNATVHYNMRLMASDFAAP
jgi:hypothetical protein